MRIFVGNLDWAISEDALERLFEPYGEVERAQVITDRETGRSRGFGFVEMPNLTETGDRRSQRDSARRTAVDGE